MKLTILLVAIVAIVAVQAASVQNDLLIANKSMLEKQRFCFEMMYRVDHDFLFEEWIKMGGNLIVEKEKYMEYDDFMDKFYQAYKAAALLPQGEFFGNIQRNHLVQSKGLFGFFYYAKDWNTFVQNAVWARLNVNEGMFVYAFTLAVIHRQDMQGLILPQIYEIFPQMFLSQKYIMAAEKFDWDLWNRQIMLEKELKSIYDQDHYPTEILGNRFYMKSWKVWQWWKLMGLDDGWHMEQHSMLRENIQEQQKDPMWSAIYSNLKMLWMPVDYTRDIEIMNDEAKLSYFTEDIGWNAYWYYLNMDYSNLLQAKDFDLDKDRRGAWWMFNVQQLLARYYMERLSQGLGMIELLSWHGEYQHGYDPQLIAFNGNGYTFRKNYWEVESNENINLLNKIKNIERRVDDFIMSGRYVMRDGTLIELSNPKSLGLLGDMMQGNIDVMDDRYFGYWLTMCSKVISDNGYLDFLIEPSVSMNYETMLRDPLSYSLLKIAVNKYYDFKYQFQPYSQQELLLPGVEILDVDVSKLATYMDLMDIDMTTLLNEKMVFHDGMLVWDKALLGRQMRLNHKPFNFNIKVQAKEPQKVVVNVFLGPEFDQFGQKLSMVENRENYMILDKFVYELVAGENLIHRNSQDFSWTGSDPYTYSELYNYLSLAIEGKYEFHQNISQSHSLFPDRLILPYGWVKGMPMAMFFMISPYNADYQQHSSYDQSYLSGIGSGVRFVDNMPFGYPLDRKIENWYSFWVPNMYMKSVKIYHLEKYDRYFPMKYENYGKFDYNF